MPTNAPRSQPAAGAKSGAVAAALAQQKAPIPTEETTRKPAGYGLPCSKCKLYYPADLELCPHCHHKERVGAVTPKLPPRAAQTVAGAPDIASVEKEREEFLRQFKSQLLDTHAKIANATESACTLEDHRLGEPASAEVCKHCYERLQERLDVCEAALHMDLKEAAQIIYDAVWADPSDPNKTYQNAAHALLTELRKRAGLNSVMAPFQPLSD
jgi:hypothetical protein